ncbi:hypothetical protein SLA2020_433290 [Shorea laevis]
MSLRRRYESTMIWLVLFGVLQGICYCLNPLSTKTCLIYRVIVGCLHPISSTDPIAPERAYFHSALLQAPPIDFATHTISIMWNLQRGVANAIMPIRSLIMRTIGRYDIFAVDGGDVQM